jgi:hypothetical protein
MVFWLSTIMFLGCQTASTQVTEAVMLEQQGDSVAAFDIYKSILTRYPNTPEAKTSLRRIQRMQLKMAKDLENTEPQRALVLYQSIFERWPTSEYGELSKQKIATLSANVSSQKTAITPQEQSVGVSKPLDVQAEPQPEVQSTEDVQNAIQVAEQQSVDRTPQNTLADQAETEACETARKSESRIVWQQYKQSFPTGVCIQEAEAFLTVVAPRQMELDRAKSQAAKVRNSLKNICVEYRLVQTTSNERACDEPSRALMTEFVRLQKRKSDLLSSGEPDKKEYYEKWIPPRWNTLSQAERNACGELNEFVDELVAKGIDRDALESQLSNVRTCFADQGNIE